MELKKIIKSTSYLVSSKLVQFLLGIIKSKIAAVYLGTIGVGLYSQVQYLTSMLSQLTLLSLNGGLVKNIAQHKEDHNFKDILKGLVKSYIIILTGSITIAAILCLVFANQLTVFFLGDIKYFNLYLFGIACVPILMINSLSFSILKSYKATKEISISNILSSALTLVAYVPLVYFYKIPGAILSLAVNFLIILYINNYQARHLINKKVGIRFNDIFKGKIEKKYLKELLYFAFFGATTGIIYIASESVCRSIVINMLGIDKLGVYSPITSWSSLMTGFITPAIQIYLFPRFSECKSNKEISNILNDYFYLITFLMIPFLFFGIPFRNILIPLFYTKDFLEAGIYLPYHFIGVLFNMWWVILAMVLTPTGRIKTHGILASLMALSNIAIVFFLVPRFGLYGWMLKFVISSVVFSIVYMVYLYFTIHAVIQKKIVGLMVYVITVSFILIAVDQYGYLKYALSFLFVGASLLFLSKKEKEFLKVKIRSIVKGKNTNNSDLT